MRILIIEDEASTAKRLEKLLKNNFPDFEILAIIDTIEDTTTWLTQNKEPDLIFADIQLSDGLSLDIFKNTRLTCPVIFTTAYDEYALEAFKVNGIDYLLKPVNLRDLEKSIEKLNLFKERFSSEKVDDLIRYLKNSVSKNRERFLVKTGRVMKSIPINQVAYFMIVNQLVQLICQNGTKYSIDLTMDELEKQLDQNMFFRVNRQMIVSLKAIKCFEPYFNSRLLLKLEPEFSADCIVSREKLKDFKEWLDR